MRKLDRISRAGVSIVALVILVILLVAQSINQGSENERLLRQAEKDRQEQVLDLSVLLQLVERAEAAAQAAGKQPAVTTEQAIEALRKSGFEEEVIAEAVRRAATKQGAPGPAGPPGPPGAATTSTAQATTTSTTRPPATTTSTTTTTVLPTTTTTTTMRPCTLGLNVPGLARLCV